MVARWLHFFFFLPPHSPFLLLKIDFPTTVFIRYNHSVLLFWGTDLKFNISVYQNSLPSNVWFCFIEICKSNKYSLIYKIKF